MRKQWDNLKKKVTKYSLEGVPIEEYDSLFEAAAVNDLNSCNISLCLKGHRFSTGGFRWSYKGQKPLERKKNTWKIPVKLISREGVEIPFDSLVEASNYLKKACNTNISSTSLLSRTLQENKYMVRGFKVVKREEI